MSIRSGTTGHVSDGNMPYSMIWHSSRRLAIPVQAIGQAKSDWSIFGASGVASAVTVHSAPAQVISNEQAYAGAGTANNALMVYVSVGGAA